MTVDTPVAYRPKDAAQALGVSRALLYELIGAGRIPARKLGSATLILRADLERFAESLPTGPESR